MIFQNNVALELEILVLPEELPAVEMDFDGFRTGEDGEPPYDGAGQEVGVFRFKDPVTSARHRDCYNTKRSFGEAVPKQEFGNEGLARPTRALEILERIGTAEAKAVLEDLAKGDPDAPLTQDAKATLKRLARLPSP